MKRVVLRIFLSTNENEREGKVLKIGKVSSGKRTTKQTT
jgi:hypothetical protein